MKTENENPNAPHSASAKQTPAEIRAAAARLYDVAENLGGGFAADEVKSVARALERAAEPRKPDAERAAARHARNSAKWDTAPALALIAQRLRNPTPESVAFICADRLPAKWRALTLAAAALHKSAEDSCNGVETEETDNPRDAAVFAADALFGGRARCYVNGDPRGLPLFVSWPGMPRRLRCTWEPDRGMPILFNSFHFAETFNALAPDWNADAAE